jgi:hypothetical protein
MIRASARALIAALAGLGAAHAQAPQVIVSPTSYVEAPSDPAAQVMLWLADVGARDRVIGLGCGDGRLVVNAVRRFGARTTCVDGERARVLGAREYARRAGVADRIRFVNESVRATRIGDATVLLILLPAGLARELGPKILREAAPGTRVVSYVHEVEGWKPEQTVYVRSGGEDRPVHLWIVPAR